MDRAAERRASPGGFRTGPGQDDESRSSEKYGRRVL